MAMVTIPFAALGFPPLSGVGRPSSGSLLLDAAGEKAAFLMQAPETGTITDVTFRLGVVSAGDVDVRIESVSAAALPATPSGTLLGTDTNIVLSLVAGDQNTWKTATLTAGAAVTKGQWIAIVIAYISGTANIRYPGNSPQGVAYALHYTTSWAAQNSLLQIFLGYSGTYYKCLSNIGEATGFSIASNTNPDEIGNKFTADVAWRVVGAAIACEIDGDGDILLLDDSNNTLASAAIDKEIRNNNSVGIFHILFTAAVTLTVGSTYRLVFKPSTTTSCTFTYHEAPSAAALAATLGGNFLTYTARTDAGAWTDTAARQALIAPLVDGVETGGGLSRARVVNQ